MDFFIVLLIVWAALPLVLIPAVITLAVKNSKLRKIIAGAADYSCEDKKLSKKDRKPLSFTIILIIGVLFIIIAGILFATTTWEYMSGIVKTMLILSLSAVFFAASFLSDRKFGLEKTGFAFFILGGLFLPVSVIAIAFFGLFGDGFSVETPESMVPVMLVMLAVTSGVLALADFRYRGSVLSRYIFASALAFELIALTEAVSYTLYGSYDDVTLAAVILTCGYLVFMIVPALRTVPAQLSLISAMYFLSQDGADGALAAGACALVCVCISVIINRGVYSVTSIIAAPVLTINLINILTFDTLTEYGWRNYEFFESWSMGVTAVISLVFGIVLFSNPSFSFAALVPERFRSITENAQTKIKWLERAYALASAFMAFVLTVDEEAALAGIIAVLFFAVKALILHAGGRNTDRGWALTLMCLFTAFTLFRADAPDIIKAEYYVFASLTASVPLLFIWKSHRTIAEIVVYVHSCVAFGILMINAWDEREMINAVILAGIGALMLVISFMRRAKKWFILSAAVLVIVVLQLTSEIWSSVSWWVYLLLTGLIFVSYAAVNEYCRKKGQENPVKYGIKNFIDAVWKC